MRVNFFDSCEACFIHKFIWYHWFTKILVTINCFPFERVHVLLSYIFRMTFALKYYVRLPDLYIVVLCAVILHTNVHVLYIIVCCIQIHCLLYSNLVVYRFWYVWFVWTRYFLSYYYPLLRCTDGCTLNNVILVPVTPLRSVLLTILEKTRSVIYCSVDSYHNQYTCNCIGGLVYCNILHHCNYQM